MLRSYVHFKVISHLQVSPIIRNRQLFSRTPEYRYLPAGGRRESLSCFWKMTAWAPPQVFITDHFKTLNLSKPDCVTSLRCPPPHPKPLPTCFLSVLTAQITWQSSTHSARPVIQIHMYEEDKTTFMSQTSVGSIPVWLASLNIRVRTFTALNDTLVVLLEDFLLSDGPWESC